MGEKPFLHPAEHGHEEFVARLELPEDRPRRESQPPGQVVEAESLAAAGAEPFLGRLDHEPS